MNEVLAQIGSSQGERRVRSLQKTSEIAESNFFLHFHPGPQKYRYKQLLSSFTHTHTHSRASASTRVCTHIQVKEERSCSTRCLPYFQASYLPVDRTSQVGGKSDLSNPLQLSLPAATRNDVTNPKPSSSRYSERGGSQSATEVRTTPFRASHDTPDPLRLRASRRAWDARRTYRLGSEIDRPRSEHAAADDGDRCRRPGWASGRSIEGDERPRSPHVAPQLATTRFDAEVDQGARSAIDASAGHCGAHAPPAPDYTPWGGAYRPSHPSSWVLPGKIGKVGPLRTATKLNRVCFRGPNPPKDGVRSLSRPQKATPASTPHHGRESPGAAQKEHQRPDRSQARQKQRAPPPSLLIRAARPCSPNHRANPSTAPTYPPRFPSSIRSVFDPCSALCIPIRMLSQTCIQGVHG